MLRFHTLPFNLKLNFIDEFYVMQIPVFYWTEIQIEHVQKPPTIKTPPYLCIFVLFFALKILFIYIGNVISHSEIQNLFILKFFPH